ncbi:MAG: class I SAM-dependent methyltransferase [Anaerolineae bacterium]
MTSVEIILPGRENIYKTSDDDPSDYYYRPISGALYRQRLKAVAQLLGGRRFGKLLEVGYGSGVFLPELSRHCSELYGVDVHSEVDLVQKTLEKERVAAQLSVGDVRALEFPDGMFDAVVCVSVLEHIRERDLAIGEIARVTDDSGIVVLGFPVRNVITNALYRAVGYDPLNLHPSSHCDLLKALSARLKIDAYASFPRFLPMDYSLYVTCRCVK